METIIILLVILWFLGYITAYTLGGWIHFLLLLAVVLFIVRLLEGRRSL